MQRRKFVAHCFPALMPLSAWQYPVRPSLSSSGNTSGAELTIIPDGSIPLGQFNENLPQNRMNRNCRVPRLRQKVPSRLKPLISVIARLCVVRKHSELLDSGEGTSPSSRLLVTVS